MVASEALEALAWPPWSRVAVWPFGAIDGRGDGEYPYPWLPQGRAGAGVSNDWTPLASSEAGRITTLITLIDREGIPVVVAYRKSGHPWPPQGRSMAGGYIEHGHSAASFSVLSVSRWGYFFAGKPGPCGSLRVDWRWSPPALQPRQGQGRT